MEQSLKRAKASGEPRGRSRVWCLRGRWQPRAAWGPCPLTRCAGTETGYKRADAVAPGGVGAPASAAPPALRQVAGWVSRRWAAWAVLPSPNPVPGLTHVQRGRERVEASDWRRVLAAGQVQARAAAEGTLCVGLRSALTVTPGPAALPAPAPQPRLTRW